MLGCEGKPVDRERFKSTGGMGRLMEPHLQGSERRGGKASREHTSTMAQRSEIRVLFGNE